jgi:hypothetical protein
MAVTVPMGPCLLSTRALGITGYSRQRAGGQLVLAHRLAWERAYGPVPDGMKVLHRCDVRNCIEPTHLFLGTQGDNVADMMAKGRWSNQNAGKTHCDAGHEFTPENTNVRPNGHRRCRACRRKAVA